MVFLYSARSHFKPNPNPKPKHHAQTMYAFRCIFRYTRGKHRIWVLLCQHYCVVAGCRATCSLFNVVLNGSKLLNGRTSAVAVAVLILSNISNILKRRQRERGREKVQFPFYTICSVVRAYSQLASETTVSFCFLKFAHTLRVCVWFIMFLCCQSVYYRCF